MWRLLLCFAIAQLAHASCPKDYDLVKDGECRGYQDKRNVYFSDGARIAKETCDAIQGKPIIIHNEEHQSYWNVRKPLSNDGYAVLGIMCNIATKKYEWADGSAIDYKPAVWYNPELDKECSAENSWLIYDNGSWDYGSGRDVTYSFTFFCTTQLEQSNPGADVCDTFADDVDDGVCYQVGEDAENWKDAQMKCKEFGADLASIHNKRENDFIRRLAVSKGAVSGVVLGAEIQMSGKTEGTVQWIDGSEMDYTNYYPGFPKKNFGDCIVMDTSSSAGQWMNVDCATKFPVACMRKMGNSVESTCTGEDYEENTIITSPGYPFSSSTPCDYFLAAEPRKKVELEILALEANSCCDSLILYDGYIGGTEIAKLSGSLVNTTYTTTTSNIMRVSWQPDGGVNVKGVAMTFRSI